VLDYLLCYPDEPIARERFLTVIWGYTDEIGVRTLDNHIRALRRALKDDTRGPRYIETVSGQGYRWIRPVEIMA
jgi:DNA-binding winged helix-turn-helix (wHTH) protein